MTRPARPNFGQAGHWVLAACAATAAHPAGAETTGATMAVSMTVEQACHLDVRPLRFETRPSDAAHADAESSLAVACTPDSPFTVSLDEGRNGGEGRRRLASAQGTFIAYDLYSDAARTRRWGAGLAEAVSRQADGAQPVMLPIYGRIKAASAAAGPYSDVITVTVSF